MKEKLSLKAFKKKRFIPVDGDQFVKGGAFLMEGTGRRCPPPIEEKIKSTST